VQESVHIAYTETEFLIYDSVTTTLSFTVMTND